MNIQRRLENHYKRWNISLDYEEQRRQLQNRVRAVLDRTVGKSIAEDRKFDRDFAEILGEDIGIPEHTAISTPTMRAMEQVQGRRKPAFGSTRVCEAIDNAEDLKQLVTALQVLFLTIEKHNWSQTSTLVSRLRKVVGLTPNVEFRIARRGNCVTLYPAGAQPLDDEVVNDVLAWLKEYPKVARPFEQALKIYMKGDTGNYRSLFDNLRRALEELLRNILGNRKSFENQKKELLAWLKGQGLHQQVVNMYQQLLFGPYSEYQNNAIKHGEEYTEDEVEFMIYLTGTFMRLLLQLQAKTP